jgi:hypothetical protein
MLAPDLKNDPAFFLNMGKEPARTQHIIYRFRYPFILLQNAFLCLNFFGTWWN